jgi:hypothetical protein
MVQVLPMNSGRVYVGLLGMNKTTKAGVLAVLGVPTQNVIPAFTATVSYATAEFNLADIFIDVEVGNEGVIVSCIVA